MFELMEINRGFHVLLLDPTIYIIICHVSQQFQNFTEENTFGKIKKAEAALYQVIGPFYTVSCLPAHFFSHLKFELLIYFFLPSLYDVGFRDFKRKYILVLILPRI